ncbi:MAG: dihydroorotase [Omnitrophica WOR_2 bacterium GWF2_38_59]|nr:MAG: dihydroorotase [Omnitrophica WOR_2 bacterium GWF2_38_59]OGX54525.1 MAG: dihydroorotase [Omnitrophica WOR_2 bacterium RIFOXYA12_FULL_38_10]OGX54950.1 MAG: dihydroorotase [Omnitrophica WOR_2 bacterium RIFOXYC2_FULL_38_12]
MSLLIKNATIVNATKKSSSEKDILIEKGVIAKIGKSIKADGMKIIDAKGKYVLPGLIDLHVHLREPGREDRETIESGSKAAAKGGFTTVVCMPNTNPVIDNCMIVEAISKESKRVGLINIIPAGAITKGQKGEELSDMFELKKAGCLAVTEDGKSVSNSGLMRYAMEYCKMVGLVVMDHCQDHNLLGSGVMNEGDISTELGLKGDPGVSETIVVARDIELARYLDSSIHLQHISLARSISLIRGAKKEGIKVTAEVCPHHFTLTEEAVRTFDTSTKVNPPLRTKEDVAAIKKALKDGTVDCISTDHAPHTYEDKESDFDHAPFGMIGLETALGLVVTELVNQKVLSWPQVVEKMSAAPARILGLVNKGKIEEGADADIVIIAPETEWEFKKEEIVSKSKNSPFIGRKLMGLVETTICGGKVVY